MAKVYANTAALMAAINKDMRKAMEEAEKKSLKKAKENAEDFYSQDSQKRKYVRTGKYGDAPDSTGVNGFGNHQEFDIYMNPDGHGYTTGTFSAQEVWQAAENHTAGVLGKPGRWAQTEDDIKHELDNAFSKRFERA